MDILPQPYFHAINPFAIQLTESFGIRWYGLAYLAGFLAGYFSIRWMVKHGKSPLPLELVGDFVFSVAMGCLVGGRLGYCFFYRPELFMDFRSAPPFWGVFAVNEGGMASHGGILGIILVCIWFGRRHKLLTWHLLDLTILGATLGIFFGRIANFINGELVGRACEGRCWFPVQFPQDLYSWIEYSPGRLPDLSRAMEVGLQISPSTWNSWIVSGQYASIASAINRVVHMATSGNAMVQAALQDVLIPRHPSQLYASLLEGLLIFCVLICVWFKPRKPGVITGLFLVFYSIGRVVSEQFRQPDLHIGFQAFGLTRGQWLSVTLFLGSALFLWIATTRPNAKLGGWGQMHR